MLVLAVTLVFVTGAGYGKSNVMEKKIGGPTPDLSVMAKEVKPSGAATGENPAGSCGNITFHPFTIHLEMNQYRETAMSAAADYGNSIGQSFVTRTQISNSMWYSVDHGSFRSAKEAVRRMQELKAGGLIPKDAYVGPPVPYAVEIAGVSTKERALREMSRARKYGVSVYMIQENESCFRVLSGAFPNEDTASYYMKVIINLGLPARVAPR